MFRKVNWRILLVGALAGVLVFGVLAFGGTKQPIVVKWLIGPGHNMAAYAAYDWNKFEQETGIRVEAITAPSGDHYELALKDWQAGGGSYDLVTLRPMWNGTFMRGYLLPLNSYFDKYNFWDAYNDIIPQYRTMYDEWNGKVYAVTQDGDMCLLYYRKDILGNPKYQAQFKAKYGYDLPVPPQTWKQLLDVAQFFTGWDWDNDGQNEYGLATVPLRREFVDIMFYPMFADYTGGQLIFDKDFHPNLTKNLAAATQMLRTYRKLLDYMPPGWLNSTFEQSFKAFVNGQVAMALNFGDIGRFALNPGTFGGSGSPANKDKIGYAMWPGVYHNGKLVHYSSASYGRIIGISKFSKHPDAAFKVLELVAGKTTSIKHVSNIDSGDDPYSHYMLDSTAHWTINVDPAYLNAIKESMAVAMPDPMIPGAAEYDDALCGPVHKYLSEGGDEKAILESIEQAWNQITDRLGYQNQLKAWQEFLKTARALGFHI